MADDLSGIGEDIAALEALLADERKLHDFVAASADVAGSDDDARLFLRELIEGLEDAVQGRVLSHDQLVREFEERYRRRPTAAE